MTKNIYKSSTFYSLGKVLKDCRFFGNSKDVYILSL